MLATNGSVENIERLRNSQSGVSVAFVQGGTTSAAEAPELLSLGTLFYEPFWVFSRVAPQNQPGGKTQAGMRVSFGPAGSGTAKVAHELAAAMGLDLSRTEVLGLGPVDAGERLLTGDLDLICIVAAWDAPIVRRLLLDRSVQVRNWPRADAHVALRPYLSKLMLPRGIADIAGDRPPEDVTISRPRPASSCGVTCIPRSSTCCSRPHLRFTAVPACSTRPASFQRLSPTACR